MTRRPVPARTHRRHGVLRRRWRLIALVALLAVAVAVVWSARRTPIYQATASVLVSPAATPTGDGAPGQALSMRDERQVARSLPVARIVAERFHTSATPEQLLRHVSVQVPQGSRILRITYADPAATTAKTGADAFAAAYLAHRKDAVTEDARSLVANLGREIANLTTKKQEQEAILAPDSQATAAERDAALTLRESYGQKIADLERQRRGLEGANVDPGSVIQPARLPGRPIRDLVVTGGLGLAVGLLVGTMAAFVVDRTDRRLRGRDDLAALLDRPVLTPIPPMTGKASRRQRRPGGLVMLDQPNSPAAEAYRTLRTRVSFLADRLDVRSIMVTSAAPAEGKSTIAANLALALAEAEREVLLVSADLRRPRLHRLFALPNRSGLSDVLVDARLHDAHGSPAAVDDRIVAELWSVAKHLWVIVSRPSPPSVTALLGSDAMRRLLQTQRDRFDFVILDCPPVLATADALAVAPLVDGVLVVADKASTDRAAVVRLREQLEQVGGRVLGAVLNRDRSARSVYQYEA